MKVDWQGVSLLLRPVEQTDRSFIFSTWIPSYLKTMERSWRDAWRAMHGPSALTVKDYRREPDYHARRHEYYVTQGSLVDRLWRRCTIATREAAPATIHAWICGAPGLLHYAFVPKDLSQKGLCTLLVREVCGTPLAFTHRWPFERVPNGWHYAPDRLEES